MAEIPASVKDEIIRRNTPNTPGDVILSKNGRDAFVVLADAKSVAKLKPEVAARHHARAVELIAKAHEQYLERAAGEAREAARVAALPWNRARRFVLKTWASFRAGCIDYFFDRPAEAPSPIVHDPSRMIPARTLRQRERRKAKANAASS